MIKLYQFPAFWGVPNVSTFCLKLETYLRMAKVPYETISTTNLRLSPTGKFPFIKDDQKTLADSRLIIDYLTQKYGDSLDQHLSTKEQGFALAIQRMIEEHLYWVIVYSRWLDPQGWPMTKKTFFSKMSGLLRALISPLVYKSMQKRLKNQGLGVLTPEQIYELGKQDVTALAHILGDNKFILGEQPSSLDACAYGTLLNIIQTPIHSPLQIHARTFPNLVNYCQRMTELYWQ